MIIKQIKLSNAAKDKLSRLKGKTGIQNWNVLCRWAFCFSLKEGTIPTDIEINSDIAAAMIDVVLISDETGIEVKFSI